MSVKVGVHAQRLLDVVAAVQAQLVTETDYPCVHGVELLDVPHREVEVHLLRDAGVRPAALRQFVDLLERKARGTHQSAGSCSVRPSPLWRNRVGNRAMAGTEETDHSVMWKAMR